MADHRIRRASGLRLDLRLGVAARAAFVIGVLGVALTACAAAPTSTGSAGDELAVVATTTVLADMVRQVGGSHVRVTSLVPRGGDVHTFEPRPSDVLAIAKARLLVMNGLGLDDWLAKTATSASADGTPLIRLGASVADADLLPGDDPGSPNPHLFMDLAYGERYVDEIATALERVDPANAADYAAAATAYKGRLAALDAEVRARVATIPVADRRIVTFHDAFPYYARAYGLEIIGTAVPAPGQDPTAGYTAQLIEEIKRSGVKAIFSESQFPTRLVDQLATETGARVVANLYDDSVGNPPADTYEGVITWDTDQIVKALK